MVDILPILPKIDPLEELQKQFCQFLFGGKISIGRVTEIEQISSGERVDEINMYSRLDGKLLMQCALEKLPVNCDVEQTIKMFMRHPDTLRYEQTSFSPKACRSNTLNYWVPPIIKPESGDCREIIHFLKTVICRRNRAVFMYLIMYLAHMWQKPEEKPGVAIVLLGGQGTGKGTFFQLLANIWTRTTLQVSSVEHMLAGSMQRWNTT